MKEFNLDDLRKQLEEANSLVALYKGQICAIEHKLAIANTVREYLEDMIYLLEAKEKPGSYTAPTFTDF